MKPPYRIPVLLCLSLGLSLWMHRDVLPRDLTGFHVWRQSMTMWNVRNFNRFDGNILHPRLGVLGADSGEPIVSRYEFPLFQYMAAGVQRLFGERMLYVRLLVFLIASLGVVAFYLLLVALNMSRLTALIGALFWQCSPLFYFYSVNPFPDVLALSASTAYLLFLTRYQQTLTHRNLWLAAVMLLVATLAKLPFLMFSVVGIKWFFTGERHKVRYTTIHAVVLFPALAWYAWVMPQWSGNGILTGIFANQISWEWAGRLLYFHLTEMFPVTVLGWGSVPLFLAGITRAEFWRRWWPLAGITLLYLLLQLNMIGQNHDYYLLPLLPWLLLAVTYGVDRLLGIPFKFAKYLLLPLLMLAAVHAWEHATPKWEVEKAYFNPDLFLYQEELQRVVPQDARVLIANDKSHSIFSYLIDKQGLSFERDRLKADDVENFIRDFGAEYLYSDSRTVDTAVAPFLDTLLLTAGSVRVYRLAIPRSYGPPTDTVPTF